MDGAGEGEDEGELSVAEDEVEEEDDCDEDAPGDEILFLDEFHGVIIINWIRN